MQENRTGYQPLPYQGMPRFIQSIYPGFNGAPKPTQYNRKAAIVIGSTQMIIGITCLILSSVLLSRNKDPIIYNHLCPFGYGIWGGLLFFIAGLLQALSGKKVQSRRLINAALVMCIIAACISVVVIAFGILEAIMGDAVRRHKSYYEWHPHGLIHLVLGSIMAILAFMEAILSIAGSAFCCAAVCCHWSNVTSLPIYFFANQPFMNQENNHVVKPLLQSSFPGHPSYQQMPLNHPQVPLNLGLASSHPSSYHAYWNPEAKLH